jgi:hypothetical protein
MTIRVTIENLEAPAQTSDDNEANRTVTVSRRPTSDLMWGGEVVGQLKPGEKKEFYFWKENNLVLAEESFPAKDGQTTEAARVDRGISDLNKTVEDVLNNSDLMPENYPKGR